MDQEKRISPRFEFIEPVAYGQSEIYVNGSVAGNISLSGVSLKVQGFIPIGTVLELQLRLGESPKVVWVKGEVVRMREILSDDCYEIGLRFIKDEKCIRAVGEYVNACRLNQQTNKELKSYG